MPDREARSAAVHGRAQHLRSAPDSALLQVVLGKDELAWRELLRRFRPLIYRCILRVVQKYDAAATSDDINEIFSDVCLSLLRDEMRKLRAYDPERGCRLGSWLGLLSINAAYDFLRQTSRRPTLVQLEAGVRDQVLDRAYDQPSQGPSALEQLLQKEQWGLLNDLLEGFSERDRRFVDLYYGNGLRAEEVAAVMGISVKTVYSKKNKLRSRLLQLSAEQRLPAPACLPPAPASA